MGNVDVVEGAIVVGVVVDVAGIGLHDKDPVAVVVYPGGHGVCDVAPLTLTK